jgi:hypothetical protein
MVLKLQISDELERKLVDRARAAGQQTDEYAQQLLERTLSTPSLDEVLKPFRDQVKSSGMSEDELDSLVEQAREARARDRQG